MGNECELSEERDSDILAVAKELLASKGLPESLPCSIVFQGEEDEHGFFGYFVNG